MSDQVVTDERRPAFCYQELDAMRIIRGTFEGKSRQAAVAIYQALTEVANEERWRGGRDGFAAGRRRIAEYAGVGLATFDRYARRFEELGLVRVTRRREGEANLPNTWV